jgi:peptide/nickel transport system substrate-binding protein
VTKYPYDLRQTERLMQEAGLTKGGDGVYASTAGERFSPELRATATGQEERENAIVADVWRRAGVDVRSRLMSAVEDADREVRATFPAFGTANTGLEESTLFLKLYGPNAATPANRWAGSNRGGWVNPGYDRLYDILTTNLDRNERVRAIVAASKLASEEVPLFPLYYNFIVQAHVAGLKGPQAYAPGGQATWDVQKWELQ